jgi:hypothetical protein
MLAEFKKQGQPPEAIPFSEQVVADCEAEVTGSQHEGAGAR